MKNEKRENEKGKMRKEKRKGAGKLTPLIIKPYMTNGKEKKNDYFIFVLKK